jgi:glycosyltransferase involved in cell wall biosynthesis
MKILHFIWSLTNGGAENLTVDLANAQADDNELTVMVGNDLVDDAVCQRLSDKVRLIRIGRTEGSSNPYWIFKLLIRIWLVRPDVIHVHNCNLIKLHRLLPCPMVLTVHTTNVQLTNGVEKFASICCISRAVLRDVAARYPTLRPTQIDNGIDVLSIRQRVARMSSSCRIVQVGRLDHATKGQDLLIHAVAALKGCGAVPPIQADFIGDGPSYSFLECLARTEGVASECRLLGGKSRDEIYASLHEYDLLVQPSRVEGFGLTVAEGLAAKVPVLVSDIEGPMEVIAQGAHGYFFGSDDPASLVQALKIALNDLNSRKSVDAVDEAWKYVREKYDVSVTAARYVKIYEDVRMRGHV